MTDERLTLVPMTFEEANHFVERFHRHVRKMPGMKFAVGAALAGVVVGVACVGRPVARHLDDSWTLEVNRLCTDGTLEIIS